MRRAGAYFSVQLKRAVRLLPLSLAVTLILSLAAAFGGTLISEGRAQDAAFHKVSIGIVIEGESPYIMAGLRAMESFDSSRSEISYIVLDEAEADAQLHSGEIAAYLNVPADFFDTLYSDDVHPMRFVMLPSASGLNTLLTKEAAEAVTRLMTETQNAEYGALRFAADTFPERDPYYGYDKLIDRYFAIVLDRDELIEVELAGLSGSLSFSAYYFCGIAVAFMLFWGIGASPVFFRRSRELSLVLRARGLGEGWQVLGEFGAYYLLMFIGSACAIIAGWAVLRVFNIEIPELKYFSPLSLLAVTALTALPIAASQFFLYEISQENPGAILLQFILAALQAYLAGCFYPWSFFSDEIRAAGEILPGGAALRYFGGAVSGAGGYEAAMVLWTAAFLALSALLRRARRA